MKIPAGLVLGVQGLALSAIVGQIPGVGANPLPPKPAEKAAAGTTVPLDQGSVKGFSDAHGNSVFLGIPFAETTGGENRYVIDRPQVQRLR
jgi:carboxylesterase type B